MEKTPEGIFPVKTPEQKDAKTMLKEARDYWKKIKEDGKIDGKDNSLLDGLLQTLDQKEKDYDEAKKMLLAEFKRKKVDVLKSMLKNGYTIESQSDFNVLKKIFKLAGIDYNLGNYSQLKSEIDKTGESTNDGFVIMYDEANRSFEKEGSKLYVYSDIDFGSTDSAGVITKSGKFVKIDSLTAVDDKTLNNNELQEGYGVIASTLGEGSYYALNAVGLTVTGELGEHPTPEEALKNGFSGNLAKGIVDGILDMGDAFEKIFTSQEARDNFIKLLTSGNFWSIVIESIKQDFKDITAEDAYIAGKAIPNVLSTLLVAGKAVQVTGKILNSATRRALNMVKKAPKKTGTDVVMSKPKQSGNEIIDVEVVPEVKQIPNKPSSVADSSVPNLEHNGRKIGRQSYEKPKTPISSSEAKLTGKITKLEDRLKHQEDALKKATDPIEKKQIQLDIDNTRRAIQRVKKLNSKERGLVTGTNKIEGLQKPGDIVELKGGIKIEKTSKPGGYKVFDKDGKLLVEVEGNNKALSIKKVEEAIADYRKTTKKSPDTRISSKEVTKPTEGVKQIEYKKVTQEVVDEIKKSKIDFTGLSKLEKFNKLKILLADSLNNFKKLLTSKKVVAVAGGAILTNGYSDIIKAYQEKYDLSEEEIKSIYEEAKKISDSRDRESVTSDTELVAGASDYKLQDVSKLDIKDLGVGGKLDFDGKRVWYRVKDGNGKKHNFYFYAPYHPNMSRHLTDGKGDIPLSNSRHAKSLTQWIKSKNKQYNIKVS